MSQRHIPSLIWILILLSLSLTGLGVCVGSAGSENLLLPLLHPEIDPDATTIAQQIVSEVRLPRTLGAWAAGALLGLAGALAQGLFRNPLADPYLLGSASGASFGVALTFTLLIGGMGMFWGKTLNASEAISVSSGDVLVRLGLTGAAFLGAVLAVLLTLTLANGAKHPLRLLLAGVIVGVILRAATQLVLLSCPDSLQAMQAFMLGATTLVGWTSCVLMFEVWVLCLMVGGMLGRVLDGLSLGEATAHSLGLPLNSLRVALVLVLALATGTAVAQTGLIAFVGLAAPHMVRSIIKTKHTYLMLLASLTGGALLMAADTLARWLIAPQELPVGLLTALLGGVYLMWLMHRNSRTFATGVQ